MKKTAWFKVVTIFVIIAVMAFVMTYVGIVQTQVTEFEIEEYEDSLSYNFSCYEQLEGYGTIETSFEARKTALEVFWKVYGNKVVLHYPYRVSYDEKNQIWHISGSSGMLIQGGPQILINKKDGKILAVWCGKI